MENIRINKTPRPSLTGAHFAGFTLLEVLVAIAILAISLSALIQTTTANSRTVTLLREQSFAHWVAMNKMTELHLAQTWPSVGIKNDKEKWGNHEWGWSVRISETPNNTIRQAEVEVYRTPARKEDEQVARLVGFLLKPALTKKADGSTEESTTGPSDGDEL